MDRLPHHHDADTRAQQLETSRQHLLAQGERRLRETRRGGLVPMEDALQVLSDFIEHALGEGFAAAQNEGGRR